jgi:hypothetical protein
MFFNRAFKELKFPLVFPIFPTNHYTQLSVVKCMALKELNLNNRGCKPAVDRMV